MHKKKLPKREFHRTKTEYNIFYAVIAISFAFITFLGVLML